MATAKIAYAASANLTVTNLNSLAASSSFLGGWKSAPVDNTTDLYLDYRLAVKITAAATNTQAGEIRVYLVGPLDDSNWPDSAGVAVGSEGTGTWTSAEIRDAVARLGAISLTTATASRVYFLDVPSVAAVFGGNLPKKFAIFITHTAQTTTNAIASSGNQVTITGAYATVT